MRPSMRVGTMRVGLLLAAPLLATMTVPSQAAPTSSDVTQRSVRADYTGPGGVSLSLDAAPGTVTSPGAWQRLQGTENKVRISLADQSGRQPLLQVDYVPSGQRATKSVTTCAAAITLAVAPRTQLRAEPLAGRCTNGQLSAPTSGTIAFRFSRPPVVHVAPPSKRWALIIGIHDYQRPTHDTVGGDKDAAAVRSALLHSGWRSDHIRMVSDSSATPAGITAAINWLVARSAPDTFTLLHYSGHVCIASRGPCGQGHTYLWTSDNRFIAESTMAAQLRRLKGHSWLDFSGCEAAAFDDGLHSADRLVTASSQAHETSYERPDWGESVWAGLLWDRGYLQGQANAGRPYSANIDQLFRFASQQATASTANQPAGAQHPYRAGGEAGWRLSAPPG